MAKPSKKSTRSAELSPLLKLWILRILVPLGGHRKFINQFDFSNDGLAEGLGFGPLLDSSTVVFDPQAILTLLRKQLRSAEKMGLASRSDSALQRNVNRLQGLVGLTDTDGRVLEFVVALHNERYLDVAADFLGMLPSAEVYRVLSVVLDAPQSDIRASLSSQGALARSGLVSVDRSICTLLRGKLDLLSPKFGDSMVSSDADPVKLLRDIVAPAGPPQLAISDYGHVATSLQVVRPYLKRSMLSGRRGVNIYVHGASGTGKTELVKVLAAELGCELFEVASEDGDGNAVGGERRLRAFRAAQSFFSQRQAMILFDEVEDVFSDGEGGRKSVAQPRKAWINRILEENPVPTLWLSNSIDGIDPAFIRRFDIVFELPVPPKAQRQRILEAACGDLIPADRLAQIATAESLAPAVVTRAAAVMRTISEDIASSRIEPAFGHLIDRTLVAQGHRTLRRAEMDRLPEVYDPAFIQANTDLSAVAAGLMESKSGRLCLYGPPGTGKTAFAHWLADQLDSPLVSKRASDLISKWVGDSERHLASAFAQADQDGAVLLIDEVDSFLQDRRGALRSWEVSLVNEMLTQMEAFGGVFIASTNLIEGLDPASLRRFDLKVKFDYMRSPQSTALLCRYCAEFGLCTPSAADLTRVAALGTLTPGDFAAVGRQHRFRRLLTAADWVAALEAECALKPGVRHAVGFY